MARHPARDGMDRVLDVNPPLLEHVSELSRCVLRLRHGQPVTGDDDHPLRVGEQRAQVFG